MIPTVEYIQERFDLFNDRFFGGQLPPIPIRLSHAKGFLGKLTYTRKKNSMPLFQWFRSANRPSYQYENFVLRINVRIDLPENVVEDTILHEMIHYYIAVNQWKDTSAHGKLFRQEMNRINQQGGRHISITHQLSEQEKAQSVVHKERYFALIRFADGQIGIKVVPAKHITRWHTLALRRFSSQYMPTANVIQSIDWYKSSDPFFSFFPSSTALRIILIKAPQTIPLHNAERLQDRRCAERNVRS